MSVNIARRDRSDVSITVAAGGSRVRLVVNNRRLATE
jgi:hypothetical protein